MNDEKEVKISPRTGKPMKKPRGGNSPMIGMNGYNLEPGDNTKLLSLNIELFNMPDISIRDAEQVSKRMSDYFALYARYDMKPTVAGMAIALGIDRRTLLGIVNDYALGGAGNMSTLPRDATQIIKKAYRFIENLWESYMNSGKINPVSGIFLAKNNYGYRDQTEYVVTPNTNPEADFTAEDIKKRYLPEGGETDGTDESS